MLSLGDIFLPSGGYQTQSEADALYKSQQDTLFANDYLRAEQGNISADTFARDQAAISGSLDSTSSAAASGFASGLGDGLKNIKDSFTGFGLFKLIPPWLWIVLALVVFWWIGGVSWSKGRLNK